VSIVWYIYGTFLGFNGKFYLYDLGGKKKSNKRNIIALPFLARTEVLLYPIGVFAILFVASLFGVNISQTVIGFYFGSE
jgi:hypothetical protein